jgi:V/A-type H+-transporting ATPase subunit I
MEIPEEFRDYPRRLQQRLAAQLTGIEQEERVFEQRMEKARRQHGSFLIHAATRLNLAQIQAELSQWLRGKGALVSLCGWVPKKYVARLRHLLDERIAERYMMQVRDPLPEEREQVPSYSEHNRLLQPFAAFVRNYGVPRYGEIDPTWLFAMSYVLMFGMMFGDIGQGLVIAAAALVLRRRLKQFTIFVVAIGLSSAAFGVVYGSVFGYEEWVHPLWMSPLSDPVLMLQVALAWGVAFITLATLLTVHNSWVEGASQEALWGGKGLVGLLLYIALLFGGWQYLVHERFGILESALIGVPLLAILIRSWRTLEAPPGERLLVAFIEGFETVMSYVTNTLSFLRVAAFSLNHVALIVAVFTLAGMLGGAGHWITVVLGNLFVLVLEGAIVAIQVLRLEYYEGFSRFYRGDGVPFKPLVLGPAQAGRYS